MGKCEICKKTMQEEDTQFDDDTICLNCKADSMEEEISVERSKWQPLDFDALFKGHHTSIFAKSGAGKTTLLKSIFLSSKSKDRMLVHFRPDYERMSLYEYMKIPIVETKEEILFHYFKNTTSHLVWHMRPKFVTQIDPYDELIDCMYMLLRFKEEIMQSGKFETNEIYFLIDEAQNMMSSHYIDGDLQDIIAEGRKYGLFVILVSQRMAFLHQTAKTQSSVILGYQSLEKDYLNRYELKSPSEFYTFYLKNSDGKEFILKSFKQKQKKTKEDAYIYKRKQSKT